MPRARERTPPQRARSRSPERSPASSSDSGSHHRHGASRWDRSRERQARVSPSRSGSRSRSGSSSSHGTGSSEAAAASSRKRKRAVASEKRNEQLRSCRLGSDHSDKKHRSEQEQNEDDSGDSTAQEVGAEQHDSGLTQSPYTKVDVEAEDDIVAEQPPLPSEPPPPPLPDEPTPGAETANSKHGPAEASRDDGWEPVWDAVAQAYYFYNRFTHVTQWENPRVPVEAGNITASNHDRQPPARAPGTAASIAADRNGSISAGRTGSKQADDGVHHAVAAGYNPAIHGSYDPNADYAQTASTASTTDTGAGLGGLTDGSGGAGGVGAEDAQEYEQQAGFNRFTGQFANAAQLGRAGEYTDDAKSRRQMHSFFDVDAAANSHDGRSLKAERQGKKLTKSEVKAFRERKNARKEEKRRAWLRD